MYTLNDKIRHPYSAELEEELRKRPEWSDETVEMKFICNDGVVKPNGGIPLDVANIIPGLGDRLKPDHQYPLSRIKCNKIDVKIDGVKKSDVIQFFKYQGIRFQIEKEIREGRRVEILQKQVVTFANGESFTVYCEPDKDWVNLLVAEVSSVEKIDDYVIDVWSTAYAENMYHLVTHMTFTTGFIRLCRFFRDYETPQWIFKQYFRQYGIKIAPDAWGEHDDIEGSIKKYIDDIGKRYPYIFYIESGEMHQVEKISKLMRSVQEFVFSAPSLAKFIWNNCDREDVLKNFDISREKHNILKETKFEDLIDVASGVLKPQNHKERVRAAKAALKNDIEYKRAVKSGRDAQYVENVHSRLFKKYWIMAENGSL